MNMLELIFVVKWILNIDFYTNTNMCVLKRSVLGVKYINYIRLADIYNGHKLSSFLFSR